MTAHIIACDRVLDMRLQMLKELTTPTSSAVCTSNTRLGITSCFVSGRSARRAIFVFPDCSKSLQNPKRSAERPTQGDGFLLRCNLKKNALRRFLDLCGRVLDMRLQMLKELTTPNDDHHGAHCRYWTRLMQTTTRPSLVRPIALLALRSYGPPVRAGGST